MVNIIIKGEIMSILKKSDLSILLDNSKTTLYWLGFLLGDGYINKNRLTLTLAVKDKNHVKKFAKYIKCPNLREITRTNAYSVSAMDSVNVPKIIKRTGWNQAKTYNPSKYRPSIKDSIPILIGLIDADGTIGKQSGRQDCVIRFHVHSLWLDFFTHLHKQLCKHLRIDFAKPYIAKHDGYMVWNIANKVTKQFLYNYSITNELPVLNRKWKLLERGV